MDWSKKEEVVIVVLIGVFLLIGGIIYFGSIDENSLTGAAVGAENSELSVPEEISPEPPVLSNSNNNLSNNISIAVLPEERLLKADPSIFSLNQGTINGEINLSNADLTLRGTIAEESTGKEVALIDINNDGYDDMIIGAPDATANGYSGAGKVYIFYGGSNGIPSMVNLSQANVTINGIVSSTGSAKISLSGGDINNDSLTDLVIGMSASQDSDYTYSKGKVYIFWGTYSFPTGLNFTNANVTITGINYYDYFGSGGTKIGDVNCDGLKDLIVGAYYLNDGQAFIFYGRNSWSSSFNYNNANVTFNSSGKGLLTRENGIAIGDINGDGCKDIILGDSYDDPGTSGHNQNGITYVFYGSNSFSSSIPVANANVSINGTHGEIITGEFSGSAITSTDMNGDGYADIIIGAYNADVGGTDRGRVDVVYGAEVLPSAIRLETQANITINGTINSAYAGYALSSGDYNKDGYEDILIGAYGSSANGISSAGETYLIYGSPSLPRGLLINSSNVTINGASSSGYSGESVQMGDANGDGFSDIIIGAYGVDANEITDSGESYLILGKVTCNVINRSTTLTNNLTVTGDCFIINASNIYLDGNGYTLIGNGSGSGINISSVENVTIKNIILQNFSNALYFGPSSNLNNVNDTIITANNQKAAFLANNSGNNTFNNVSFVQSATTIGENSTLSNQWYVDVNVRDGDGNLLSGANISAYNLTGSLIQSQITPTSGAVRFSLPEYLESDSGKSYHSNYTINVTKNLYSSMSQSINLTQTNNTLINFTINPGCGEITEGMTFSPTNISASGDCFKVTSNNLIINGNGLQIIGDGTGSGLNLTNRNNVTITNLGIRNFQNNLLLFNATNISYYDSVFNNASNKDVSSLQNSTLLTINATFNQSKVNVDSSSNLVVKWKVSFNITNNQFPLSGAQINAYNLTGAAEAVALSNALGAAQLNLTEYSDSNNIIVYSTPHNIVVNKTGYNNGSTTFNLSQTSNTISLINLLGNSNCTTITTNLVLQRANISKSGTCFTITGSNIQIEGNETTIQGNGSGSALYFMNVSNVTLNSFTLLNFSKGVYLYGSSYIILSNLTLQNNTNGIYFEDSSYNNFTSGTIQNSSGYDLYLDSGSNNILTDVNTTNSSIYSEDFTKITKRWYIDVTVNDTGGNALSNVTTVAYNYDGSIADNQTTSLSGTTRLTVSEFYKNEFGYTYITPQRIVVSKPGYFSTNSSYIFIDETHNTAATFNLTLVSCGISLNQDLTLGSNLNSSGTCFTVGTDNIIINGNGYTLQGNGSGTGINLNGHRGINLNDLTLRNYTQGIVIGQVNNSNLSRITLLNNQIGLMINSSNNNIIRDSVIANSSSNAIQVNNEGYTNNTLINVSVDINNITITGTASLFLKWYVTMNVTYGSNYPLQNSNATGRIVANGDVDDSRISDADGLARLELTELKKNASGVFYYTPQNITTFFNGSSGYSVNNILINLTQTNNTPVNVLLNLTCTIPYNDLSISSNTLLCPGIWEIPDTGAYGIIRLATSNVALTCDNTHLKGSGSGMAFVVRDVQNVSITGCTVEDYNTGIYADNIYGYNLTFNQINMSEVETGINAYAFTNGLILSNFFISLTSTGKGITQLHGTTQNYNISNGTFSGGLVGLDSCTVASILTNSQISGVTFEGDSSTTVGICLTGNNNNITNNTFINNRVGININSGTGNNVYYNNFNSSFRDHVYSVAGNLFNTSMNITYNNSGNLTNLTVPWGNTWDDICNLDINDTNNDSYGDSGSDYPYNVTNGANVNGSVTDYGPKIISCPSENQTGAQEYLTQHGGSSRTTVAAVAPAATAAVEAPPPAAARTTPKVVPTETLTAQETKKFLKIESYSQNLDTQTTQVKITLQNTGKKRMLLFPELDQQTDDPYFIITRKTLGAEDSLFSKISDISYSPDSITGRLLKAEIVNPEQILLNPGETVEKTLEIKEGLVAPKQMKIQFTTFGETVNEQEVKIEKKSVSGTAVDVDTALKTIDVYAVIVPEELSKKIEGQATNPLTGAAVLDLKQTSSEYLLEFSLGKKGSKGVQFGDIYGPYVLKEGKVFVFAQQLKYNSKEYNGQEVLRAKIYHGGEVIAANEFNIDLK
ncbi:MAG: hypothetical protein V2A62_02480 [Candidatus Woesearchaeota archaeon]